jgi:hypothetical protein
MNTMRFLIVVSILAVQGLFASAALAAPAVDDPAPEIEGKEFVGNSAITLRALRGCVVACVFFRTTDTGVAQQVEALNSVYKFNRYKRFYILGITDESRDVVESFVASTSPAYPIVIAGEECAKAYGVEERPSAFLVAANGKIAWTGRWSGVDAPPDALVAKMTEDLHPLSYLTGKLEPCHKLFCDAKWVELRARLTALAANPGTTNSDRGLATDAVQWIDFTTGAALLSARWREKVDGYVVGAFHYRQVISLYKGLEAAKKASEALDAILADPDRKREVTADEKYFEVYAAWSDSRFGGKPMSAAEKTKAIATLKGIAVTYKGTKAAPKALELAAEIEKSLK